jgi:hypothetical protein
MDERRSSTTTHVHSSTTTHVHSVTAVPPEERKHASRSIGDWIAISGMYVSYK